MAININDNFKNRVNRPTDFRYGPFISVNQANSFIPLAQRYHGLVFGIYTNPTDLDNSDVTYYYYYGGLTNTEYKPLLYTHPPYTPITASLSGSEVVANFETDEIGSVTTFTTRSLSPGDIGAEPAFNKGTLIQGTGIILSGSLSDRLVGSGNITISVSGSVQGVQGIQGIQGTLGIQGTAGTSVTIVGSLALTPGNEQTELNDPGNSWYPPQVGDGVIDNNTGDLWVYDGTIWDNVGQIRGPQGIQGIQGSQGIQGPQGITGVQGITGTQGTTGTQGIQGITGTQGIQGTTGTQGIQGIQGITGAQGIQGITGTQGTAGVNGVQGIQGIQGTQGTTGTQGVQGITGSQGTTGTQGTTGAQGITGSQGTIGSQGIQGIQGSTGTQGAIGSQGTTGAQGIQGIQGITGTQGTEGAQGTTGAQGIQGRQGIQGLQGRQGTTGTQGTVGTQGIQGIQGIQGTIGLQGIQGIQGSTGAQGITGSQGTQGTQGITGSQGTTGTQGITGAQGTTGAQGIQGTTGTQGLTGIQGTQGTQGIQGITGISQVNTTCGGSSITSTTDIWAIIDVTSGPYTGISGSVNQQTLCNALGDWYTDYQTANPGFSGNLYIGTTGIERYVGYLPSIKAGNLSINTWLDTNGSSSSAPTNWNTVDWVAPDDVLLLAFVNESNSDYHGSSTTPTLVSQPFANYTTDFNNFTSSYITSSNFAGIIYPAVNTTSAVDRNFLLHAFAVLNNIETITSSSLTSSFGDNYTSNFDSINETNPYFTNNVGLWNYGWNGVLNKGVVNGLLNFTSTDFANDLNSILDGTQTTSVSLIESFENQILILRGLTSTDNSIDFSLTPGGCVDLQASILGAQGVQGIQGIQGITGAQGIQGRQGTTGNTGLQGIQGITGLQGTTGAQGTTGTQGIQGRQGITGNTGLQGTTGTQGIQGITGNTGLQGTTGAQGIQGRQGTTGNTGLQGIQGITGLQGTTGAQGIQGRQGTTGNTGLQGITGSTGAQGIQGITGNTGAQGTTGAQGIQGRQGTTGTQGIQGRQGTIGAQGTTGAQGIQGTSGLLSSPTLDQVTTAGNTTTNSISISGLNVSNTTGVMLDATRTGNNANAIIKLTTSTSGTTWLGRGNSTTSFFSIGTSGDLSSASNRLFTVDNNGNILLGANYTISTSYRIDAIRSIAGGGCIIRAYNPDISSETTYSRIELRTGLNTSYIEGVNGSGGAGFLRFINENSERMRIASTGNVLIGSTTDPGAKLFVNGDIRTAAPSVYNAANWKLGEVSNITPPAANRLVRVEIDGNLVSLLAYSG